MGALAVAAFLKHPGEDTSILSRDNLKKNSTALPYNPCCNALEGGFENYLKHLVKQNNNNTNIPTSVQMGRFFSGHPSFQGEKKVNRLFGSVERMLRLPLFLGTQVTRKSLLLSPLEGAAITFRSTLSRINVECNEVVLAMTSAHGARNFWSELITKPGRNWKGLRIQKISS